jgi:glycine/sarcosine N-methyltransferase
MTENERATQDFYDNLAGYYDDMIRFHQRLAVETDVLKQWQERYRFRNVLDAGCGSGLHTFALSALGLEATGVDQSANMIQRARENARKLRNKEVTFLRASFDQLPECIDKRFDAVFCLGNSLAHCTTQEELIAALKAFHHICNSGGRLIVQLLNYQNILSEKKRIIAINRKGKKTFIRFYDFIEPLLAFNILSIDWQKKTPAHVLQTTKLYPYTLAELKPVWETCGFVLEAVYGRMDFEAHHINLSPNLILVARRQQYVTQDN